MFHTTPHASTRPVGGRSEAGARRRQALLSLAMFVVLILTCGQDTDAQTLIEDEIWGTLSLANSPYLVVDHIAVPEDSTLILQAGVEVHFRSGSYLLLRGNLVAEGTPESPVYFRSELAEPDPGSWRSVILRTGANVDFTETWIEDGGANTNEGGMSSSLGTAGSIVWNGGGVRNCGDHGISVNADLSEFRNLTIEDNAGDGLAVVATTPPVLEALQVNNNSGMAIKITGAPGDVPLGLSGTGNGLNAIYVDDQLGGDSLPQTWTWDANPNFPVVVNRLEIQNGNVLRVAPGAVVKFNDSGAYLRVWSGSRLETVGGTDVWFTSLADDSRAGDTNGDGASQGSPGDFRSILLRENSSLFFRDTYVSYGGANSEGLLHSNDGFMASLDWEGGGLIGGGDHGIDVNCVETRLRNLAVNDHAGHGLAINPTFAPELDSIDANGNGLYAIYLEANPGHLPNTLTGSNNGVNGVVVGGDLASNDPAGTWVWSHSPGFPVVIEDVEVSAANTLEIEPGSVVKFLDSDAFLWIFGALNVPSGGGTTWFTSLADDAQGGDTNNDGAASLPWPGDWRHVALRAGAVANLNDTWFAYGGSTGQGQFISSLGTAADVVWTGGGSAASAADGARFVVDRFTATGVQFLSNEMSGLRLTPSDSAIATSCEFVGNEGLTVLNLDEDVIVDATNSWWGHVSGPYDPTDGNPDYNPDGLGGPVSDFVMYRDWAPAPTGNQPPSAFTLQTPEDGTYVYGELVEFTWDATVDPEGEDVVYDLEFSTITSFGSAVYERVEGLTATEWTVDTSALPFGTSYWRVVARDEGLGRRIASPGFHRIDNIPATDAENPTDNRRLAFETSRVQPNPAAARSELVFSLPKTDQVTVRIVRVDGRLVRTVHDGVLPQGRHTVAWSGEDARGERVAAGVYFYQLTTSAGQLVERVTVLRQ